MLDSLAEQMDDAMYALGSRISLHGLDKEEKESILCNHSSKLDI